MSDGNLLDNENKQPQYYTDFVTQLRSNMDKDNTKPYYISAAPQCPIPDGSIPLEAMAQMDFVWVQFYNNGVCNIDQPGFQESFLAWSKNLAGGPKLYIGAPACPTCAKSGYPDPAKIQLAISGAKGAGVPNFGGVMLWDGSWAVENMAGGKDYIMVVKEALA